MGKVFSNYGALAAEVESVYGTDPTPTKSLRIIGKPTYNHDDQFEEQEFLLLDANAIPAGRKNVKLDLSGQSAISYMEDAVGGKPDVWQILNAGACEVKGAGLATGVGNFVEIGPKSSGFGSTALRGFKKEDAAGHLGYINHLGYRCNWTLNVQGGSPPTIDFEGSALHAFWTAFGAGVTAPTGFLGDPANYIQGRCWTFEVDFSGGGFVEVPFKSFSFSPNNEISIDEGDVTACATGVDEILLDSGTMTGTVNVVFTSELVATSGNNYIRGWEEADQDSVFRLTYNDGVQMFRATFPKVRVQEMQLADGDTRDEYVLNFIAQADSGDDNFTFRWEVLAV